VIRPGRLIPVDARELWEYRELFLMLAWRRFLVRYKQTGLGVLWAVVRPVVTMILFTLIFGRLAGFGEDDPLYALRVLVATLPWYLFSTSLQQCSESVVGSANMVGKVYFPRVILPVSACITGVADFLISGVVLAILLVWYRVSPGWPLLALPAFLLLALAVTLALGIGFAAANVYSRDIRHVVPFLLQVLLFASPVGYPTSRVPAEWLAVYCINPLVVVVEGFRWSLLGQPFPVPWPSLCASVGLVVVLLVASLLVFWRLERQFADVI
jgi:lipopolysaccharide transport system permease protein